MRCTTSSKGSTLVNITNFNTQRKQHKQHTATAKRCVLVVCVCVYGRGTRNQMWWQNGNVLADAQRNSYGMFVHLIVKDIYQSRLCLPEINSNSWPCTVNGHSSESEMHGSHTSTCNSLNFHTHIRRMFAARIASEKQRANMEKKPAFVYSFPRQIDRNSKLNVMIIKMVHRLRMREKETEMKRKIKRCLRRGSIWRYRLGAQFGIKLQAKR